MPFISITIPAYKNVPLLKRLLDSIAAQNFKDYEVIITDDTPDDSVQALVSGYSQINGLQYFKNSSPLGTPENWNEGIRKASGAWIKIMHHDDWFAKNDALAILAKHANANIACMFSGYQNIYIDDAEKSEIVQAGISIIEKINKTPWLLFASNKIGPPSVTMIRNNMSEAYDNRLKWRVDTEYYIRMIQHKHRFHYIDDCLINVGMHSTQVTQSTFLNPKIELAEGLYLLEKHGVEPLENIWVYDAWWRLFRNLQIKNMQDILKHAPGAWPMIVHKMVVDLSNIPPTLLSIGFCSKTLMAISYLRRRHYIHA